MKDPGTEAKLAFLRRPEAWPEETRSVEVEETHMAWVFLTDRSAWKLKKPTQADSLNFATPELRRLDCEEEVRINRRLAPHVYRGVVVLTVDVKGRLAVGGPGQAVDWLVSMERLPKGGTLEDRIRAAKEAAPMQNRAKETGARESAATAPAQESGPSGALDDASLRAVAKLLADFHGAAPPVELGGPEHRVRLAEGTEADRRELLRPEFGLPAQQVDALADAQRAFVDNHAALFDARVAHGRVIEGHGDLRPEHVWLTDPPVVIDGLEFSRDLRLVDAVDEMAFLELECARLGAPEVGARLRALWTEATGDDAPDALWRFHRTYRCLRRAKIALWHLDDRDVRHPEKWRRRAARYLELASPPPSDAVAPGAARAASSGPSS